MGKVFIEESTLTDIGDALRRKHGETRLDKVMVEETVPDVVVSKTPNATGFDSWSGVYHDGIAEDSSCVPIQIANANFIKIKIGIELNGTDLIYIANGNFPDYLSWKNGGAEDASDTIRLRRESGIYEYIFNNTDSITIKKMFYGSGSAGSETPKESLGYYAEVWGLDADGNNLGSQTIEVEKEIEVENKYNPLDMPEAIDNIKAGSEIPDEAFYISGNCQYRFYGGSWDWFIEQYKDRIITENLKSTSYMFDDCISITSIPFDMNFDNTTYYSCTSMFDNCRNVLEIGKIVNLYPESMNTMFSQCRMLRYLPEFINLNLSRVHVHSVVNLVGVFSDCSSLRNIPEDLLKELYCTAAAYYYCFFYSNFTNCYALDELRELNPQTGALTSNTFSSTFKNCYRIKEIIFATQDDGTPYSVNWKSQTIDLGSYNTGYCINTDSEEKNITTNYNSGITEDKKVYDDETYQALKDDADWYTRDRLYSRYNKVSALNTINSLPDTSAYLASAGGTNTIKFKGVAGEKTDGGAINTLTAEEIAVATAKGWTVTLV